MIDLIDDGTTKATLENTFRDKISSKLNKGKKANPPENYLVIFLFACHGVLYEGNQSIVLNEYDNSTKWYKLFAVEKKLRMWAEIYPNAYIIGIFACCRQLWDSEEMTGLISKVEKNSFT